LLRSKTREHLLSCVNIAFAALPLSARACLGCLSAHERCVRLLHLRISLTFRRLLLLSLSCSSLV
jgi:hypothetical protein